MDGGRRRELDREISSYMASRKGVGWVNRTLKNFARKRKVARLKAYQPKIEQALPVQDQEFEDMSPGVWGRMSGFFGKAFGKKEEVYDDYDFAPDVEFTPPEDVLRSDPGLAQKQSLRITPSSARMNAQSQLRPQPVSQSRPLQQPKLQVYDTEKTHSQPKLKITTYEQSVACEQPKKRGWSFFGWGRKKEPEYVQMPSEPEPEFVMSNAEREVTEIKEDMREVTKIFLKSMERVPSEELAKLKRTEEFDRLKVLLKKHNVIK